MKESEMMKLTINLPGHKFNGAVAWPTFGCLDSAYYHRVITTVGMKRPVPVIICGQGSAVELLDIFEADELLVTAI